MTPRASLGSARGPPPPTRPMGGTWNNSVQRTLSHKAHEITRTVQRDVLTMARSRTPSSRTSRSYCSVRSMLTVFLLVHKNTTTGRIQDIAPKSNLINKSHTIITTVGRGRGSKRYPFMSCYFREYIIYLSRSDAMFLPRATWVGHRQAALDATRTESQLRPRCHDSTLMLANLLLGDTIRNPFSNVPRETLPR